MLKRNFHSILFLMLILAPQISVAAGDVATLVRALPEFRDISVWKGRAGLTLFSPDGKFLAVSGKSADVVIYETETGEQISKIDGRGFIAFSFSSDGKFAVVQNKADLSMEIFEVQSGKSVREIRGLGKLGNMNKMFGGTGIINEINGIFPVTVLEMGRVPVTKDWKNLLVNKNDKEFSIVDFETGELRFDLNHANFHSGWESAKLTFAILAGLGGSPGGFMLLGSASNAQFSENGKYLLIANGNKKPTLWDIESGDLISKFDAGERVFYSRFSPDETMVATSDYRGITKIWKTSSGELLATIGGKNERGIIAGWNADSTKVFINPLGKGDLRSYDPVSSKILYDFAGSAPNGTVFSYGSTLLVTTPQKNKSVLFQIWETETGRLLATVPRVKKQNALVSIKWNPNSEMIATTEGIKKEVKLWNIKGEHLQTLKFSTMPMQFSDDGRYLATGGVFANSKIDAGYLWDLSGRQYEERIGLLK